MKRHNTSSKTQAESTSSKHTAAPAFWGTKSSTPDTSIESILTENDKTLYAIAASPWLSNEQQDIREFVDDALDEWEKNGFFIKQAVYSMWEGERDRNKLLNNLNMDSALIVQRILMHTMNIEADVDE